jgi:hypothetical protein
MSAVDTGVSITDILKYISSVGVVGILVVAMYGGYKKWWVFGWNYRESEERTQKAEKERDDWRDLALHGTNLAEQTVDLFRRSRTGGDK